MINQENVTKFEFLLTLEGNIIVQRFFNVKDHVKQSRRSMDLHYYVKNICEEIAEDLKIKSSNYLCENQNFFYIQRLWKIQMRRKKNIFYWKLSWVMTYLFKGYSPHITTIQRLDIR